jgi:RNA polymerase sigma factor (sigma-70 family)
MSPQDLAPLVQSAQSGNKQAFGQLVTRFAGLVTGVAYSVCGDFARSEDIGQEAFLEAWSGLSKLREPSKFSSWICTIARRRAIDAIRHKQSRPEESLQIEPGDSPHNNPEIKMAEQQERDLVWSMLDRLPETYRETMVLYYRGEQSVRDVASALDENESTVRQRLKRGREMLRSRVIETVSKTLQGTAPQAAFTAAILTSLPSAVSAGVVGASGAAAGKTVGAGSLVSTVSGGAILGPLIGIAGGMFGVWCSWRNAEYERQQDFIIKSAVRYGVGMIVFLVLLGLVLAARLNGFLDSTGAYLLAWGMLMGSALMASAIWTWRVIVTYKRLEDQAIEAGEPRRTEVAKKLDQFRENARTLHADGTVGYEAFQWNAGGWFGSMLGSSCWMALTAGLLLLKRDFTAGALVLICFLVAIAGTIMFWNARANIKARLALNWMLLLLFVLATVVLSTFQFLTSAASQSALSWTPWAWLVLLIFPALGLNFYFIQRGTEKNMLKQDQRKS